MTSLLSKIVPVLTPFIVSRLALLLCALAAMSIFPLAEGAGWRPYPGNPFLDAFFRWDSGWYKGIIENGYYFSPGQQSNVAFFPLYPLIVGLLTKIGLPITIAGLIVSNLSFILSLCMLREITLRVCNCEDTASRAVAYCLAFPAAFFFSAFYTEGLFLCLSVGVFYTSLNKKWLAAGILAALASATRPSGIILTPVIFLLWLDSQNLKLGKSFTKTYWLELFAKIRANWIILASLFIAPMGLIAYMIYLHVNFGDWIAFAKVQESWGRHFIGPWGVIHNAWLHLTWKPFPSEFPPYGFSVLLDLVSFVSGLVLSIFVFFKLGPAYGLFCVLTLLMPGVTYIQSMTRYMATAFPIFILLSIWGKNLSFDRSLLICFSLLQGLCFAIFATGHKML